MIKKSLSLTCLVLLGFVASAKADTLHGFCSPASACTSGATIVTSSDPLTFGFDAAGGSSPDTGTLLYEFLVPNNLTITLPSSFGVTGTVTGTATEFSTTAWTTGQLDGYLGISASPTNPIGNYSGSKDLGDTGASGFFVYQLNLGTQTLPQNPSTTGAPAETVTLPDGSFILAFLSTPSGGYVATADSESILEEGTPPPGSPFGGPVPTPEPSSLILLGTGTLAVAGALRRFKR